MTVTQLLPFCLCCVCLMLHLGISETVCAHAYGGRSSFRCPWMFEKLPTCVRMCWLVENAYVSVFASPVLQVKNRNTDQA